MKLSIHCRNEAMKVKKNFNDEIKISIEREPLQYNDNALQMVLKYIEIKVEC